MIYTYEMDGTMYTVNLERRADGSYQAVIGDRTYTFQAEAVNNGGWLLTYGARRELVYSAAQGDQRYVNVGGHDFTLAVTDARSHRRRQTSSGGDLKAQMPGQVVDVLATVGENVTRGQTLVVLEAMKMEIRVSAPVDGVVKRLLVAKGDVVERGQLLLEVEE
ncbi:MAG: acetyl-CoA carboxylase biotin carboxyl carrier protein subunit [Anaerolineaceae bacterium]|nr:acetyl-CoA carboxylase biotin carboxyl carrier protein subunit [Anaerolineaceae bacterium]